MGSATFITKYQLDGFEQFQEAAGRIKKRKMGQILRNSLMFATTPLLRAVKNNAPRDTGTLKRSIQKTVKTYASGNSVAIIGPAGRSGPPPARSAFYGEYKSKKTGRFVIRDPSYYAHLVEFGHRIASGGKLERKNKVLGKPPPSKGFGKVVGYAPGHPFLRPAFESTKQQVEDRLISKISEQITKELAK